MPKNNIFSYAQIIFLKLLTLGIILNIIFKQTLILGGCYVTVKRNLNESFNLTRFYDFKNEDSSMYQLWLKNHAFNPNNPATLSSQLPNLESKKTYFIPMPPPNITGQLHLGHALFLTLQDILTRYHRSNGKNTLWLPGTDHAGISIDQKIKELFKGEDITEEKYFKKAWQWKESFHHKITNQIKAMGASCDWSRERFTLDENYQKSTIEALKICEKKNMLYKKDNDWYLDMKALAQQLLIDLDNGLIKIEPLSGLNTLKNFLKNIEPWCISRQIRWGQQLPIFISQTGKYFIAQSQEEANKLSKEKLIQEKDTFDTWFNSSLWPFAILGWPEKTADYKNFYPANIIETADDIIFFWCARMLMMGKLCTGIYPFSKIYLHGIIRDEKGEKMSKNLGNGIDPLEITEKYGTDTLRWTLATQSTAGEDAKLGEAQFKASSLFINKFWQASKFILINQQKLKIHEKMELKNIQYTALKTFYPRYHELLSDEKFLQCARELQHLFWHDFCDKWIEENKKEIFNGNTQTMKEGIAILEAFLILFHPFIPFMTEKINSYLDKNLLIFKNNEFFE